MPSMQTMIAGQGTDTQMAWRALLEGQASDFEYWGPEQAMSAAGGGIQYGRRACRPGHGAARGQDNVGPSIFLPMHTPYNPHGAFEVATMAYDTSGVKNVSVKYRTVDTLRDFTYGSAGWTGAVEMRKEPFSEPNPRPPVWVDPKARADEYRSTIDVQPGRYVQYFVEEQMTRGTRRDRRSAASTSRRSLARAAGKPGESCQDMSVMRRLLLLTLLLLPLMVAAAERFRYVGHLFTGTRRSTA